MKMNSTFLLSTVTLSLSCTFGAMAAQNAVDDFDDVEQIVPRDDGLYDVRCSYGDIERGYSLDDLKNNRVCNAHKEIMNVHFRRFALSGRCLLGGMDFKPGVKGTFIQVNEVAVNAKDRIGVCSVDLFFAVPTGYKLGVRRSVIGSSIATTEDASFTFRYGVEGDETRDSTEIDLSKNGTAKHPLSLDDYVYTECSDGHDQGSLLGFSLILTMNGRHGAGTAQFTSFELDDVKLKKCQL